MAIIREFRCNDCGKEFESMQPVEEVSCPVCSSEEAEREFRTAPGFKTPDSNFTDKTIRGLAEHHGLSDISNKDGQAVKRPGANAGQFTSNPAIMSKLAKMGDAADNASPILPMLRAAGGPRNWSRVPEKRK